MACEALRPGVARAAGAWVVSPATLSIVEGDDLGEPSRMPFFRRVPSAYKRLDQFVGQRNTDDPAAQNQDVHVIVLDTLVRGIDVVADGGAHALYLVRGDRSADTTAADQHSALGPTVGHRSSDRFGVIRIVDRCRRVGPHVDDFVSIVAEQFGYFLLERKARVIGANHDAH